jgi:hypothetical protein
MIALVALVFLVCGYAWGHSWYPASCCSGQDCAPVDAVAFVASEGSNLPVMVVTTKWGTKAVDEHTRRYDSPDGQLHACIFNGRVLCLFLPPAT